MQMQMWKGFLGKLFGLGAAKAEFVEPGEREITFTPDKALIAAVNSKDKKAE